MAIAEAKKQIDLAIYIFIGIIGCVIAFAIAKLAWGWWTALWNAAGLSGRANRFPSRRKSPVRGSSHRTCPREDRSLSSNSP